MKLEVRGKPVAEVRIDLRTQKITLYKRVDDTSSLITMPMSADGYSAQFVQTRGPGKLLVEFLSRLKKIRRQGD
jgi:hypothetical protein